MRCSQRSLRSVLSTLLVGFGVLYVAIGAAFADSVTQLGMGMGARGAAHFAEFEAVVRKYNASGQRFRIDGHCQSACTMFLAIRNVCVTNNANLLFHAGGNQDFTDRMTARYKPALRKYVIDKGYMATRQFHTIPGSVIISRFGYKAC
jgi:hypothetical protein